MVDTAQNMNGARHSRSNITVDATYFDYVSVRRECLPLGRNIELLVATDIKQTKYAKPRQTPAKWLAQHIVIVIHQ